MYFTAVKKDSFFLAVFEKMGCNVALVTARVALNQRCSESWYAKVGSGKTKKRAHSLLTPFMWQVKVKNHSRLYNNIRINSGKQEGNIHSPVSHCQTKACKLTYRVHDNLRQESILTINQAWKVHFESSCLVLLSHLHCGEWFPHEPTYPADRADVLCKP